MGSGSRYDAIILGAGVLGLSIATELTDRGLKVAIVARDLPEDAHSSAFASPWAGANWSSFAGTNVVEQRRDEYSFHRFAKLAEEYPELVTRTPYVYCWNKEGGYPDPWYRDLVFDYRNLPPEDVPKSQKYAVAFTSYTLNPPNYIAHLASQLRSKGVPIIRHRLSSLDEAYSLPALSPVNLLINATGLGSRTLLGVQDPLVHPVRGQTVLVRAPHMRTCMSIKDPHRLSQGGHICYVIPRPGPEGHVILGGTTEKDVYSTLPDMEVAERILRDAFELCPDLAVDQSRGWEGIEVVAHNVGLRPAREGGMRLELEERKIGEGSLKGLMPKSGRENVGKEVGVVHAYGIGSAGFQASLGIAHEASELAIAYLKKRGDLEFEPSTESNLSTAMKEGLKVE